MRLSQLILAALALSCGACAVINGLEGIQGEPSTQGWKWHGAVQLDQGLSTQSDAPSLAVDPEGTAWVTWHAWNSSGSTGTIWTTNREAGLSWATPQPFPAIPDWPVQQYAQIAVGGLDQPVVAFEATNGQSPPAYSIRAVRLATGLSVQAADIVRLDSTSSRTPQMSHSHTLAVDDEENALVAWGEDGGVFAAASAFGTTFWSQATQLYANADERWDTITTVAGTPGRAIVGWATQNGLFAQPQSITGGMIMPGAQNTLATGSSQPPVALAMRGNKGLAVWPGEGGFKVLASNNGEWGTTTTLTAQPSGFAPEATLALNSKGQAVLVWRQIATGSTDTYAGVVWGAYFDGTKWSTPQLISLDGPTRKCWWVAAGINDVGRAVVSWADFDQGGTYARIWANVLHFDGATPTWEGPVPIDQSSPNAYLADQPQNVRWINVALDPAGKAAYVTYKQSDSDQTARTWANWLE